jgi:hypothetical protein
MIFSIRYYEQTYTNEPDPENDNFLGGGFSSPSGPNIIFSKVCTLSEFDGSGNPEGRKVYVIIADTNGNESLISNVRQFTISPGQN